MTALEIQGEINGLKQLLAQTDYKALKFAEGEITENDYSETREWRQGLRNRINEFEAMTPDDDEMGV